MLQYAPVHVLTQAHSCLATLGTKRKGISVAVMRLSSNKVYPACAHEDLFRALCCNLHAVLERRQDTQLFWSGGLATMRCYMTGHPDQAVPSVCGTSCSVGACRQHGSMERGR